MKTLREQLGYKKREKAKTYEMINSHKEKRVHEIREQAKRAERTGLDSLRGTAKKVVSRAKDTYKKKPSRLLLSAFDSKRHPLPSKKKKYTYSKKKNKRKRR